MPSPFPPSLLYKFANLPLHLTLIKLIKLVFPFSSRKRKTKLETLISLSPPMASTTTASYAYTSQNSSSQRSVAMVLVLVSAIVLSPLYANPRKAVRRDTMRQNGALMGLFFPWFLLDLSLPLKPLFIFVEFIICIAVALTRGDSLIPSSEPSWVLRIGSSCWGLGGVLVMLMLVLSWQGSVHEFLWR